MIPMTEAQRLTLKAFIAGDSTLNGHFTAGRYDELATALNADAAGPFVVWRSTVSTDLVAGIADMSLYTPADNPPAPPSTDLTYSNRCFQCQLKQANIIAVAFTRVGTLVTAKSNVRKTLNDSLTNIPSGAGGALQDAGWLGAGKVRLSIQRNASVAEKVFATGTGTQGSPGDLGVYDATGNVYNEGTISPTDIGGIMA